MTDRIPAPFAAEDAYREIRDRLAREHGPMMSGMNLAKALGFSSATALRRAAIADSVGVRTFPIQGRRGRFAFTDDVAAWLIALRKKALQDQESRGGLPI